MAETKATAEKLVKIKIPRDAKKGDVYVGINERNWLIKRGIEVEVPECVVAILKDQEEMYTEIDAFAESNEK